MSAEGRVAIVDALNEVDGIDATKARPNVILFGSAWPVWVSTEWENECSSIVSWSVFVGMSRADDLSIVGKMDELVAAVFTALWEVGSEITAAPVLVPVADGSTTPCLLFTFTADA